MVIDEEQRFGDVQKAVSILRASEGGVHTLVMIATPIPRTLQTAVHRVTWLDAGPQAIAFTVQDAESLASRLDSARAKEGRVIVSLAIPNPATRLRHLCANILS